MIPNKACLTEVFVTSKSNFCLLLLIEFSLNTMIIILCQSLRPQLKLILWKSRFELFVNIISIRLGEPCFVKHVGSLLTFVKLKLSQMRLTLFLVKEKHSSSHQWHIGDHIK